MKKLFFILLWVVSLAACSQTSGGQAGATELSGTHWILEDLDGDQPLARISLYFSSDRFSGSADCNDYSAPYQVGARNAFSTGELALTAMGCSPASLMEQEDRYIKLLLSSTAYRVVDKKLTLLDGKGTPHLRYRLREEFAVSPDALIAKNWRLAAATGLDTERAGKFTLRFEAGRFGGMTSCRDYEGEYQAEGDVLQTTYLGMKGDIYQCSPADRRAEEHYIQLLSDVEQFNVTSGRLDLFTKRGSQLTFELAPDKE